MTKKRIMDLTIKDVQRIFDGKKYNMVSDVELANWSLELEEKVIDMLENEANARVDDDEDLNWWKVVEMEIYDDWFVQEEYQYLITKLLYYAQINNKTVFDEIKDHLSTLVKLAYYKYYLPVKHDLQNEQ